MDPPGGVVEWLMALVLKTSVPKGTVGSNPTPSVESTSSDFLENLKTQSLTEFLACEVRASLKYCKKASNQSRVS